MLKKFFIFMLIMLLIPSVGFAARKALVIGNANYQFGDLKNPTNDAEDISLALGDVGFSVKKLMNANLSEMEKAINDFTKNLKGNDIALFYYAGHGMQHNDENYLLPVDMKVDDEVMVENIAVDLTSIINKMQRSDLSIVVLDACRDNPFNKYYLGEDGLLTRSFRGISLQPKNGLAPTRRAKGTFIAFATDVGNVAYDGEGRNGVFTKNLLYFIRQPGYRLEDVFKRVREAVLEQTNEKQIPWDSSSITGTFYFVKPKDTIIKEKNLKIFSPAF